MAQNRFQFHLNETEAEGGPKDGLRSHSLQSAVLKPNLLLLEGEIFGCRARPLSLCEQCLATHRSNGLTTNNDVLGGLGGLGSQGSLGDAAKNTA